MSKMANGVVHFGAAIMMPLIMMFLRNKKSLPKEALPNGGPRGTGKLSIKLHSRQGLLGLSASHPTVTHLIVRVEGPS